MNTTVAKLWGQGKVKTVRFDEKHLTSFSGAKPFVTYLRKVGLPAFCDGPLGVDKRVRLYTISQLVLLMVTAIVVRGAALPGAPFRRRRRGAACTQAAPDACPQDPLRAAAPLRRGGMREAERLQPRSGGASPSPELTQEPLCGP